MPPSFSEKIYRILRGVPRGKVTTYGALARAAGFLRAARAVGNAMNWNPYAPKVPCHRVVCLDGRVGGFARGTAAKVRMLKKEGVVIKNGRIDLMRYEYRFKK